MRHAQGEDGSPTVHESFVAQLVQVHARLKQSAQEVGDLGRLADPQRATRLREVTGAFTELLLNHHKSEDTFFYPAFRDADRLGPADLAFLHARDDEHEVIHRLCLSLRELARHEGNDGEWFRSIVELADQLGALSAPHFDAEELHLTAEHLEKIIDAAALVAVYRDMGEHWNEG